MLADNLERVEERIATAVARAGRRREEITLIAVTKIFPAETLRDAYECGLRDFGENYVQEFADKKPLLGELPGARYHLIGHLQSNKARLAGELFDVVQTVDSARLAQRLDQLGKPLDVFIEVKLSEEESKHGTDPAQLEEVLGAAKSYAHLRVAGLMTMPPWSEDAELSRPYFAKLRELATAHGLAQLSMGMSHDFEVAIAEGATHIRVGTALFGARQKP